MTNAANAILLLNYSTSSRMFTEKLSVFCIANIPGKESSPITH